VPLCSDYFFLTVSVTVILGWFFAYDGFTNLPLMALLDTFTFVVIFISYVIEALRLPPEG
jgi:hypothetical protein